MDVKQALNLYKLDFTPIETATGTYKLIPNSATATITRLNTRKNDLVAVLGRDIQVTQDKTGIMLYVEPDINNLYQWHDYNGHINFNDPEIPFIIGMYKHGIMLDTVEHCPHLLIAGCTGSGKSVFLHTFIMSACCNPSAEVFIVDVKQVEYVNYKRCCHLVNDVRGKQSAYTLTADLVQTMNNRYKDMQHLGVVKYSEYIQHKPQEKRIILVVDELAELTADKADRKIILPRLIRIAQLGRAAGIHLVIATQRPDHTIVDGVLKANIPSRLAFHCISSFDSRVILGQTGAERLTGKGDGLYIRNGAYYPEHIQGLYVDHDYILKCYEQTA